mgnify:CR=1 FL=1
MLFALGIRYVGETVAKKLAKAFKNIDALMAASQEQLMAVDEIGERIAESVVNFFAEPANMEIINRLKSYGLQFSLSDESDIIITGLHTICFFLLIFGFTPL